MDKLKMHSPDLSQANIEKIQTLFPNCVTEVKGENGEINLAVDFDLLKQELSDSIVEGPQERYHLNWPGKRNALLSANNPLVKTLRPCVERSIGFDSADNIFVEGDNLEALKLLQETYLGQVKLIYIDPPYNTGKDFIYADDYSESIRDYGYKTNQLDNDNNRLVSNLSSNGRFHSDWLSMMYSRLKVAKRLLAEDGAIFISIDDGEQGNLRQICDEIFGAKNFVNNIIWQKKYSPQNDAKWFSDNHDFILCYAKDKNVWRPNLLERSDKQNAAYKNPDNDIRGAWKATDLSVKTYSAANDYEITTPSGRVISPPASRCWSISKSKLQELIADNRIWFGKDGNNVPSLKKFLTEVKAGITPLTIWTYQEVGHNQTAKQELKELFPNTRDVFDTPKPVSLIERIIDIATDKESIVLDFFGGSATTAHAVISKNQKDSGNRKFILIQINEETGKDSFKYISDFSIDRIKRSIEKTSSSMGVRVLKVDTSNMTDIYYRPDQANQADMFAQVQNIKEDRTDEDLLFQVLLDWGVGLTLPISKQQISSKDVFFVNADDAGESADLIACFASDISNELIKTIAEKQPLRVVFRDDGFATDAVKINVEQIFKQISPITDVKSI